MADRTEETAQACLGMMDFFQNWDEWRASLGETVRASRDIDPSDKHTVEIVEDMLDFLAERTCPGGPEERLVREMWDRANAEERKTLARMFLRLLD